MNAYKLSFLTILMLSSCADKNTVEEPIVEDDPKIDYFMEYDTPKDNGQYWMPEMTVVPLNYVVCTGADFDGFGRYDVNKISYLEGLQYANMCESLTGLANRGVQNGKTKSAVWLDGGTSTSYNLCKQDLTTKGIFEKGKSDGFSIVKSKVLNKVIDGYILTNIIKNPESSVVAAVASHVYNSIIVDVRDSALYNQQGLKMTYDATEKTTKDSWKEFKDKCNNKALVLMPAQTNDLKDFAIANDLFVINIKNASGHNWDLLTEVLDWLKPCSPVYGWEDFDEHLFVQKVTESGNLMVPNNFSMNMPLTSLNYKQNQSGLLVNVLNPKSIDYSTNDLNKYVSYYLSDGDNVQWIFHIWYNGWFKHPQSESVKMAYGIPSSNLDMIAPAVYKNIINSQNKENTLVENCAGGYIYIDAYGSKKNTQTYLADLSSKISANMRQHRLKVLGLFTNDCKSSNAKVAYQKFIEANNQLEGIIVVQYVPYNGGSGEVYWYKNSDGIEIPVITVRYTIWNFGANENIGQGTPAFIASKIKKDLPDFSLIDIHAWSTFADIGSSDDLLGETSKGTVYGAGAAVLCQKRLPSNVKCVSLQELIWRMRMKHRPDQTKNILNQFLVNNN
jgi:hypothetical protein